MEHNEPKAEIQEGLVSVVMAVHNTEEEYLRYAIESILAQTYTNFEFVIIDDGSTNNALSVINSYHDDRILLIKNPECLGLNVSLNKGLKNCKGEFVARFDSDDYSYPERLEVQYQYMKSHPETIVCATGVHRFGNDDRTVIGVVPDNETYRVYLLFRNLPLFYHSSVMINRKLLLKYDIWYDENQKYCEDYKLWVCCSRVGDCTILPDVLLDYRVHSQSITQAKRDTVDKYDQIVMREQLQELHLDLTAKNKEAFLCLGFNKKPYRKETKKWIKDIMSANKRYHVYNQKILKRVLKEKWIKITYYGIQNAKSLGEKVRILFGLSPVGYPRMTRLAFSKWYRKRSH